MSISINIVMAILINLHIEFLPNIVQLSDWTAILFESANIISLSWTDSIEQFMSYYVLESNGGELELGFFYPFGSCICCELKFPPDWWNFIWFNVIHTVCLLYSSANVNVTKTRISRIWAEILSKMRSVRKVRHAWMW